MLNDIRCRARNESGFTLIELLVVILIIGILAWLSIPSFLNQRGKAYDATAKSQVKTLQTAEETYSTDHDGTYTADVSDLQAIEPTLSDTSTASPSIPSIDGNRGYVVVSTTNATGDSYTLTMSNGTMNRTCSTGTGGGEPGGCINNRW